VTGFAYWHPVLYRLLMTGLYGRHFSARYEAVAEKIPAGASVLDAACGDCLLWEFLAGKGVSYTGLDLNERFLGRAARRGIRVVAADLRAGGLPRADFVVLQGSLYQFIPEHRAVIDSLLGAAGTALILSEPVRNIALEGGRFGSVLADWATRVRGQSYPSRFSRAEFVALLREHGASSIEEIPGGRDVVGVIPKGPRR
jgi:hypothetical protein